jgi:hypothetical protein
MFVKLVKYGGDLNFKILVIKGVNFKDVIWIQIKKSTLKPLKVIIKVKFNIIKRMQRLN